VRACAAILKHQTSNFKDQSPGKFLLIDNSNSFTKFALASREKLLRFSKIATPRLTAKALTTAIRGWQFGAVVLSSVVPRKEKMLLRFFKSQPVLRVSPEVNLGVGIDFPNPKTIGADRLANAAAVAAFYGAPSIVVDFGTAVTFDIISPDRKYIGGVIAPGLEVMTDYFYQRTALLPRIEPVEPISARDAMLSGAVFGYRGLVKQILTEIKRELAAPKNLKVVATGGYAELIAAKLPAITLVHPNLTLEGLRIIATLNFTF
jgi:type III pantothenate kinase